MEGAYVLVGHLTTFQMSGRTRENPDINRVTRVGMIKTVVILQAEIGSFVTGSSADIYSPVSIDLPVVLLLHCRCLNDW